MQKNYGVMMVLLCSFSLYATQIGVQMVSSIKDIQGDVAAIIVGENEQLILSGSMMRDYRIGALYKTEGTEEHLVYLPRTFKYTCLDNVYKKNQQIGVTVERSLDLKNIITMTEPALDRESYWCAKEEKEVNDCVYQPMRKPSKRVVLESGTFEYFGEKALEEAKEDLMFCYCKALSFVSQQRKMRSIAFLPIGIVAGFPWQMAVEIAIKSVCEYAKKRPNDYDKIWLCVVKKSHDDSYPDNSHDMVFAKYWMELIKQSHN